MGTTKGKDGKAVGDAGKYVRYTAEQVMALERVYNDCPKPNSARRQQLIKDFPTLANIGQKQIKVWFQNKRCREKQRKETSRLLNWNSKLNAMNQILLEENERLQKQAAQLNTENQYLRQQLQLQHTNAELNQRSSHQVIVATTDTSSESVVTSGQQHQKSPQQQSQEASISQLSTLAEKTLTDFLAKVTGSAVDWIQMPGMKPGPDSIGAVAVSLSCGGEAARASGFVELEPFKVAEIVKNRPLWHHDCRRLEILATFNADHGGMVELVHTQMYAPTTLASPQDFCTLRYTCCLEDGSLVICERSLAAGQGEQAVPTTPGFTRAEMFPSGYLIRTCEGGGSMVSVVNHMNLKSRSISDVLHPLYESSNILVQSITSRVLCHLRHIPREVAEEGAVGNYQASSLRAFSYCLVRGFNDAVNSFSDDGWIPIASDGPSTISVCMNPSPHSIRMGQSGLCSSGGGVICAKGSTLLQGVSPAVLVRFLREHRTAWMESDTASHQVTASRMSISGSNFHGKVNTVRVFRPVAGQDEVVEVVRLEGCRLPRGDDGNPAETFMLQLCSGLDETGVTASAQLIFAPIDASVPIDSPLLPSGFRILLLDGGIDQKFSRTLDLTSNLEGGSESCRVTSKISASMHQLQSVLTISFQFIYEISTRDLVTLKAQQYVQALLDFVERATVLLCPPLSSSIDSFFGVEALVLVRQIADSYRLHVGRELLNMNDGSAEAIFKEFWGLKDAIVCCAWKPWPELVFANHASLDMLDTGPSALRELSLERLFNDGGRKTDYSQPPPFIQEEGYARLPAGVCITSKGQPVSFEHAIGWKVLNGDNMLVAAFMFCNWSF